MVHDDISLLDTYLLNGAEKYIKDLISSFNKIDDQEIKTYPMVIKNIVLFVTSFKNDERGDSFVISKVIDKRTSQINNTSTVNIPERVFEYPNASNDYLKLLHNVMTKLNDDPSVNKSQLCTKLLSDLEKLSFDTPKNVLSHLEYYNDAVNRETILLNEPISKICLELLQCIAEIGEFFQNLSAEIDQDLYRLWANLLLLSKTEASCNRIPLEPALQKQIKNYVEASICDTFKSWNYEDSTSLLKPPEKEIEGFLKNPACQALGDHHKTSLGSLLDFTKVPENDMNRYSKTYSSSYEEILKDYNKEDKENATWYMDLEILKITPYVLEDVNLQSTQYPSIPKELQSIYKKLEEFLSNDYILSTFEGQPVSRILRDVNRFAQEDNAKSIQILKAQSAAAILSLRMMTELHNEPKKCSHDGCEKKVFRENVCIDHGSVTHCTARGCQRAASKDIKPHPLCKRHLKMNPERYSLKKRLVTLSTDGES